MDSNQTDRLKPTSDISALHIESHHRVHDNSGKRVYYLILFCLIVIGIASLLWFTRQKPVEVVTVPIVLSPGDQSAAVLNASGYVTPRRKATVSSEITGRVKELLVEEGMLVEIDQRLAILDDTDARAAYDVLEADHAVSLASIHELKVALEDAQKNLHRIQQLKTRTYASQQQLDGAETTVKTLQAQLFRVERQVAASHSRVVQMQHDLDNYIVTAPFSGVVVSKDAQIGEIVSPISSGGYTRTGIATIVDMTSLEIEVDVNESYISRVFIGQRIEAVLDAFPTWKIPASVRTIIPSADRQKATIKVRIAFDELDPRVLPDMGVKVTFLSDTEKTTSGEQALISLPRSAIYNEGVATVVYLLKDDRLEKRRVSIGQIRGQNVDVFSGLGVGERVVIETHGILRDGVAAVERR